jgi:hypothetical protein
MSPEERELLDKSVALAEDNNKILHAMRRSMRIAHTVTVVYWIIIIASLVGTYYFVQPYVNQIITAYDGAKTNLDKFSSVFGSPKK